LTFVVVPNNKVKISGLAYSLLSSR